jgi:superfamily I DNA/RNA helicase
MYDDAQSIYERRKSRQFSFKSVGIAAQGRTSILKINYRNTRQILQAARLLAGNMLTAEDCDDDGVPLLKPEGCGREGSDAIVIRLPSLRQEAVQIAAHLKAAYQTGTAWSDIAVLARAHRTLETVAEALQREGVPTQTAQSSAQGSRAEAVRLMTLHASKGLEFAVVALAGVGWLRADSERAEDDARLLYVGATRAT